MKKLLTLSLILTLAGLGSISWASISLNSSRSNVYRLFFPPDLVTQAQAAAILAALDKAGKSVAAGQVTEIMKTHGVRAEAIKKILILPPDKTHKEITIILLKDPGDETQARHIAVGDSTTTTKPPVK
ncbi:MAG: hypothetical protein PHX83_03860 [Acidobacteriia bacterium]|nr:hypothetical protein [Terriglobia bacterium]